MGLEKGKRIDKGMENNCKVIRKEEKKEGMKKEMKRREGEC